MDKICPMCNEIVTSDVSPSILYTIDGPRKMHRVCGLREVIGGIGHLLDHEHFCKNVGDPDAGLDYRTSALMVDVWLKRKGADEEDNG